jgi:hypothetical protein
VALELNPITTTGSDVLLLDSDSSNDELNPRFVEDAVHRWSAIAFELGGWDEGYSIHSFLTSRHFTFESERIYSS